MEIPSHDKNQIIQRAMEILGGKAAFFAAADQELAEVNSRWVQNVDVVGRFGDQSALKI